MFARKMTVKNLFCNRQQHAMWTITAFYPWFIADTFPPLVAADW